VRTLWDLIAPRRKPPPDRRAAPPTPNRPGAAPTAAALRYEAVTRLMLERYGVRVRKWRTSTSGVAWTVTHADGRVVRLIEAPRPRGPVSAAVFLHEIGHHAIGLGAITPRCLEEYHAWRFALEQMHAHGLRVTPRVHQRVESALRYAVAKAVRRGLRRLPAELAPFAVDGPAGPIVPDPACGGDAVRRRACPSSARGRAGHGGAG